MAAQFGPHVVHASQVFLRTRLSTAFVNLRPIVPGHVLVMPTRVVRRYDELSPDEVADLFCTVQRVGRVLEPVYGASALTIAMQDGYAAGQSVAHVHVHVLPRRTGDFRRNDDVYECLERWRQCECVRASFGDVAGRSLKEGEPCSANTSGAPRVDFEERPPRTRDEMAEEAAMLRTYFEQ